MRPSNTGLNLYTGTKIIINIHYTGTKPKLTVKSVTSSFKERWFRNPYGELQYTSRHGLRNLKINN